MFKFLVYLFLFYSVSRFIFGTLLNFKKDGAIQDSVHETDNEEIKIKANPINPSSKNKSKKNNSNIGEYVDFEEIK